MTPEAQIKIIALRAEIDKIHTEQIVPALRKIHCQSQERLLKSALGHKPTEQEIFQFVKMSELLRRVRFNS